MAPKKDPQVVINEFYYQVEEWDELIEAFKEVIGDGDHVSKSLEDQLKLEYVKISKAFKAVKVAAPNYKTDHSKIDELKKKASKDFVEALKNVQDDSQGIFDDDDSEYNGLVAKLDAYEEMILECSTRLEKQFDSTPEPTNISISIVSEAYEDIKNTKMWHDLDFNPS